MAPAPLRMLRELPQLIRPSSAAMWLGVSGGRLPSLAGGGSVLPGLLGLGNSGRSTAVVQDEVLGALLQDWRELKLEREV